MENFQKLVNYLKAGNSDVIARMSQKDIIAGAYIAIIIVNAVSGFTQFIGDGLLPAIANGLLQAGISYAIYVLVNTGYLIFANRK